MRITKFIIPFFLLLSLISFSQSLPMPKITAEEYYAGPNMVFSPINKSYPRSSSYIMDGHKFRINMKLTFEDDMIFDEELYGIVCTMPDYSVNKLSFVRDSIFIEVENRYIYSFEIKMEDKGWIKLFVASKDDMNSNSDVRFYDNTSNKVSLFLLMPE